MDNVIRNGSIYTSTARFDGTARGLTEDELRKIAPSVFATGAHESRSERFQPIPTWEIVKGLQKEGFAVVGAKQSVTRVEGKAPFTKHLLRIRQLDTQKALSVRDSVFEMLLKNANDGTAAYDLTAALWRILCSNSLVAKISDIDSVKVRHTGTAQNVMSNVIEGTYEVLKSAEAVLTAPQDMGAITMNRAEQEVFADAAHTVRFGEPEEGETNGLPQVIRAAQLLQPKRYADNGKDLWTTFNVIQENVIKGGVKGLRINAETGQRRRIATRAVKGIDQDIRLNKALWQLAEGMKAIKQAA